MSKTLPFHIPHMYVYIHVVTIPSKTYFSYTRYHWLFGEVFLSTSKSKWFLNFNMHGVCSVVCGMFTAFNKIWIFYNHKYFLPVCILKQQSRAMVILLHQSCKFKFFFKHLNTVTVILASLTLLWYEQIWNKALAFCNNHCYLNDNFLSV